MVANGLLECPIGSVRLEFEAADIQFQETFIVMNRLPNPLIGLCFLQKHNALFDIRQGIMTFSYLSKQVRPEHKTNSPVATQLLKETSNFLQTRETCDLQQNVTLVRP